MKPFMRSGLAIVRDAVLAIASYQLALLLRFDGEVPPTYSRHMAVASLPIIGALLLSGLLTGAYRSVPRYASVAELMRLGATAGATSLTLLLVTGWPFSDRHFLPASVPIIGAPVLLVALGATRLAGRLRLRMRAGSRADAERVLIVGAGDAGEMVARDMLRDPQLKLIPVGFLDDDSAKQGRRIHGVGVLGTIGDLEDVVRRTRPDHVLIAMPGVPSRTVRPILHRVVATGVDAKTLPSLREVIGASAAAAVIRDVDVADLIGRDAAPVNDREIAGYLENRAVLVTGAAGSIGSELARQVLVFRPAKLLLLDNNETELFALWKELRPGERSATDVVMVVGDIRDRRRIDHIISTSRPQIVFHAAAYKHVPVMELQAAEAIKTNIMGTRFVAEAAAAHGAERFVLVSTDKAVRPVSVMGGTKRVGEMVVSRIAEGSSTIFAAVRFGNVLGSRGSVVPIFASQIAEGGPITVTDAEASRYFMTIEEAASLILQAGALATGGDTFVLDMQEPVRITDLAERMRDLLAKDAQQIEIVYTGLRPGEKLHEDLWHAHEVLSQTPHPRILRAVPRDVHTRSIDGALERLEELAIWNAQPEEIRRHLFAVVNDELTPDDAPRVEISLMSDLASPSGRHA